MDIDQWSRDSQAFKTITSGSETRNQTSNKKQYDKHRRSKPKPSQSRHSQTNQPLSLHKQLELYLKRQKQQVRSKKYHKLVMTNQKIQKIRQQIEEMNKHAVLLAQEKEQFAIYEQHEEQMKRFQDLWEDIFEKFRRKEEVCMLKLSAQEQKQTREVQQYLKNKREKIKIKYFKNKELMELSKLESELIRKQKFTELIKLDVKRKRHEVMKNLKIDWKAEVTKAQARELDKLRRKYDVKEKGLRQKLDECREFEMKIYVKHEQRLKQKFMNSLNRLEHDQKMKRRRCSSATK